MEKISFGAHLRRASKRATGSKGVAQPVCFDFVLTNLNSCANGFPRNWAENRPGVANLNTDSQLWDPAKGSFLEGTKKIPPSVLP